MNGRIAPRSYYLLALLLAISLGCSRAYYRRQADADALGLIHQKAQDPLWALHYYRIRPEAASRMYDDACQDREPMPPDDPTAHQLMHMVDGKKGYPGWHENGDTNTVQNPHYKDYLPLDEKGRLVLTADEAIRQVFLNGRNYQREMEEVYLSALDVSFERFRFDTQFFAGQSIDYRADGKDRPGGNGQSQSVLTLSTFPATRGVRATRFFTTGADLVVGFANSLVWQFSGPDDYQGNTLIDFALTQPLLRNAGRDRVMERLTRSERTLLYNVRSMERYRQATYVEIMTGRDTGQGPSRSGGVLGAGLEGFTGTGGGGFGNIGNSAAAANTNSGAQGAGAQQAGGYLGLLQQQQQIRNQEDNIVRLRDNAAQLDTKLLELLTTRADTDTVLRQRLQVAQSRQALLNAQSRLLNAQDSFNAFLDSFKITLGLPPTLCVKVEDDLIDEFQLIEPETNAVQASIQDTIDDIGDLNRKVLDLVEEAEVDGVMERRLAWSNELAELLRTLRERLTPVAELNRELLKQGMTTARDDVSKLERVLTRRRESLVALQDRYDKQKDVLCPLLPVKELDARVFNPRRLDALTDRLEAEFERLSKRFEDYPTRLKAMRTAIDQLQGEGANLDDRERFTRMRDRVLLAGQNMLIDLRFDVLALQLLQARARTESLELAKVDLRAEQALEIARRYRLDWMNARGALVDQWRLIEFNADQLEGTLDVVFSGDISNKGDNPLNLRGSTGRLRAGIQFDSPITRLTERNVYRQSLIEYQQARRTFYAFEDNVARGLRQQLRTISANELNFELQRFAVLQAAEQITLTDDIRAHQEALGLAAGATAARDSVSALSDLLDAQNNFLSVFVNFEVLRRQLDLDLGTLRLDAEGRWLDPGVIGPVGDLAECEDPITGLPELPFDEEKIDDMLEELDRTPPTQKKPRTPVRPAVHGVTPISVSAIGTNPLR